MISIILERNIPTHTPIKVDAVNYETLFPEISPILFLLANYTLMLALDAADNRKHIFFPTFAIEERAKKCDGNFNVSISI